jgi:hypothetical protein
MRMVGMHQKRTAKFVRQYAQLADIAVAAVEQFLADIQSGEFPGEAETYHMPEESQEILQQLSETADELPGAGVVTDTFLADEAMEQQTAHPNPGFAGTPTRTCTRTRTPRPWVDRAAASNKKPPPGRGAASVLVA